MQVLIATLGVLVLAAWATSIDPSTAVTFYTQPDCHISSSFTTSETVLPFNQSCYSIEWPTVNIEGHEGYSKSVQPASISIPVGMTCSFNLSCQVPVPLLTGYWWLDDWSPCANAQRGLLGDAGVVNAGIEQKCYNFDSSPDDMDHLYKTCFYCQAV